MLVECVTWELDFPSESKALWDHEVLCFVSVGSVFVFVCVDRLTVGGRMLWLLLFLLPPLCCSRIVAQESSYKELHGHGESEGGNVAFFRFTVLWNHTWRVFSVTVNTKLHKIFHNHLQNQIPIWFLEEICRYFFQASPLISLKAKKFASFLSNTHDDECWI